MSSPSRIRVRRRFEYRNYLALLLLLFQSNDAATIENKMAKMFRHDSWWMSMLSINDDIVVNMMGLVKEEDEESGCRSGRQGHLKNWIQQLLGLRGGSSSSEPQQQYNHHPQVKVRQNSHKVTRLIDVEDENDQEIDAFIENLLATVDEEKKDDFASVADANVEPEATPEIEAEKSKDITVDKETKIENGDEEEEKEGDDEDEEEEEEEDDSEEVAVDARREEKSDEADHVNRNKESTTSPEATAIETSDASSSSVSRTIPPPASTAAVATARREEPRQQLRPVRPNFVYRFLLGQGRLGHMLILLCVMVVELLRAYLPPVERFLSWAEERYRTKEQIRFRQEMERRRQQQQSKRKPKQKKSKEPSRRALQKQADQRALSQLRQLGNVAMAKYRWVSDDFMKCHGLGPFASSSNTAPSKATVDDDDVEEDTLTREQQEQGVIVPKVKQEKKKPKKDNDNDDDESDIDWIVEALTTSAEEPRSTTNRRGASSGVTVQFNLGSAAELPPTTPRRRTQSKSSAWVKSILLSSAPSSTKSSSTAATRSKGSPPSREKSVLDQLRAASGVDNMSRSLLGAYPGDAAPTGEAASAEGLLTLAQKYGYGEWSDDEDDDEKEEEAINDNAITSTSSRRLKRRKTTSQQQKRRKKAKPEVRLDTENEDIPGLWGVTRNSQSTSKSQRRQSSAVSRPRRRQPSSDDLAAGAASALRREKRNHDPSPPLASSPILNRSRENLDRDNEDLSLASPHSTTFVRPAMQRLTKKMKEIEREQSDHK